MNTRSRVTSILNGPGCHTCDGIVGEAGPRTASGIEAASLPHETTAAMTEMANRVLIVMWCVWKRAGRRAFAESWFECETRHADANRPFDELADHSREADCESPRVV